MAITKLREHLQFLHDDSGAPHHHPPMPSVKAAGQYNTKPSRMLNRNTTANVLVAGYIICRFLQPPAHVQ
jgi:hypothetical protein